jgi:GR25 family glycosyltransferase involved in LPS biosynthesis
VNPNTARAHTLEVASKIFVISLPHRNDRRQKMEILRKALNLRWTYVDAIESSDERVDLIIDRVREQRHDHGNRTDDLLAPFRWPDDIDPLAASGEALEPSGSDLWTLSPLSELTGNAKNYSRQDLASTPLLCNTQNDTVTPHVPNLPEYRILSPAKIACWCSHLSVIRQVANERKPEVTIVLEDDVDMERDIRERLGSVWNLLPATWDIVFLGQTLFFPAPEYQSSKSIQVTAGRMSLFMTH